jgi:hypothetical protein
LSVKMQWQEHSENLTHPPAPVRTRRFRHDLVMLCSENDLPDQRWIAKLTAFHT